MNPLFMVSNTRVAEQETPSDPRKDVPQDVMDQHLAWARILGEQVSFAHESALHGRAHTLRVLLYALLIARELGLSDKDTNRLAAAAIFHDSRRVDDWEDPDHGRRAATYYRETCEDGEGEFAFDPVVEFVIEYHVPDDEAARKEAASRGVSFFEAAMPLLEAFKDADALDRFRLTPAGPDESFLRTKAARSLVPFARKLVAFDEGGRTQALVAGRMLVNAVAEADAVVVGIGSGMSSASGYDFYRADMLDSPELAPFQDYYHFKSLFDGFYHLFPTFEAQWGFLKAAIDMLSSIPVGRTYADLAKLLEGKEYFILSTNVDCQTERAFPAERACLYQGSLGYLQCKQPCCDELWEAKPLLDALMAEYESDGAAVDALDGPVPRCPECGWPMTPWVRDDTFLEGEQWRRGVQRYEDFVRKALADKSKKVLFLELGVGEMTPGIITLPFWSMVERNENARLLSINLSHGSAPQHLGKRAKTLQGDLGVILDAAISAKKEVPE